MVASVAHRLDQELAVAVVAAFRVVDRVVVEEL
jgi:hypothetical protein